jgi:hypothetical protein
VARPRMHRRAMEAGAMPGRPDRAAMRAPLQPVVQVEPPALVDRVAPRMREGKAEACRRPGLWWATAW